MKNISYCLEKTIEKIIEWEKHFGIKMSLSELPVSELQDVLVNLYKCDEREIFLICKEKFTEEDYDGKGIFWRNIYPIFGNVYEKLYSEEREENISLIDHKYENKLYFFPLQKKDLSADTANKNSISDRVSFEKEFAENKREHERLQKELQQKNEDMKNSPEWKKQQQEYEKMQTAIKSLKREKRELKQQLAEQKHKIATAKEEEYRALKQIGKIDF